MSSSRGRIPWKWDSRTIHSSKRPNRHAGDTVAGAVRQVHRNTPRTDVKMVGHRVTDVEEINPPRSMGCVGQRQNPPSVRVA